MVTSERNQAEVMMIRYINWKNQGSIETVDELVSSDFKTLRDFKKELRRLVNEYQIAYNLGNVYPSQRSTKEWRIK